MNMMTHVERIQQSEVEIKPLLVNVMLVVGGGGEYQTVEAEVLKAETLRVDSDELQAMQGT